MMLRAGFTHKKATLTISVFNIVMIGIALLLDGIGIMWLGLVLLVICGATTAILVQAVRKKEAAVQKAEPGATAEAGLAAGVTGSN